MNFLADEGVDRPIVEALRQAGYHVDYILELSPGDSDEIVLAKANHANSILLTTDKDFGELVFRRRMVNRGVVLIRLAGLAAEAKAGLVVETFQKYGEKLLLAFSVLTPGTFRIRSASNLTA